MVKERLSSHWFGLVFKGWNPLVENGFTFQPQGTADFGYLLRPFEIIVIRPLSKVGRPTKKKKFRQENRKIRKTSKIGNKVGGLKLVGWTQSEV